jgi:hypothetical protein
MSSARLGTRSVRQMSPPGIHIETLHSPVNYPPAQLERAFAIARALKRGKMVLVEPPER